MSNKIITAVLGAVMAAILWRVGVTFLQWEFWAVFFIQFAYGLNEIYKHDQGQWEEE